MGKYEIPQELQLEFAKIQGLKQLRDKHIYGNIGTKKLIKLTDAISERTNKAWREVYAIYPGLASEVLVAKYGDDDIAIYKKEDAICHE